MTDHFFEQHFGLPAEPYSSALLSQWCAASVEVADHTSINKHTYSPSTIRALIKRLSALAHIALIEGGATVQFGLRHELFGDEERYANSDGMYYENERKAAVALDTSFGILRVLFHELGHHIDLWCKSTGLSRLSDDPVWQGVVAKEINQQKKKNEHISLYKGYLKLTDLLETKTKNGITVYEPHNYASEAMAEMTCHVLMLTHLSENATTISSMVGKNYPVLWPVYRDQAIPIIIGAAKKAHKEKHDKVDQTLAKITRLYNVMGYLPPSDTAEKIAIFLATDTTGDGEIKLDKTIRATHRQIEASMYSIVPLRANLYNVRRLLLERPHSNPT